MPRPPHVPTATVAEPADRRAGAEAESRRPRRSSHEQPPSRTPSRRRRTGRDRARPAPPSHRWPRPRVVAVDRRRRAARGDRAEEQGGRPDQRTPPSLPAGPEPRRGARGIRARAHATASRSPAAGPASAETPRRQAPTRPCPEVAAGRRPTLRRAPDAADARPSPAPAPPWMTSSRSRPGRSSPRIRPADAPLAPPPASAPPMPAAASATASGRGAAVAGRAAVADRPVGQAAVPRPARRAAGRARGPVGRIEPRGRRSAGRRRKPATGVVQPCVSCGLSLSATARFCRRCGTAQAG